MSGHLSRVAGSMTMLWVVPSPSVAGGVTDSGAVVWFPSGVLSSLDVVLVTTS